MTPVAETTQPKEEQMSPPSSTPDTLPDALRTFAAAWSPRIALTGAIASVATRLALGGFGVWDLAVVAGILLWWPIQEWLIHVFILHFRPKRIGNLTIDLPVAKKHRHHHRDPWRIDLVFIPLHTWPLTIPVQLALWLMLMPTQALALTGIAFTFLMTLHYEWVHFLVHTRYRPRSRMYRRLWRNHRLHHMKNERYWHGVTMLTGDHIFGTAAEPDGVPTSETCRTLGHDAEPALPA